MLQAGQMLNSTHQNYKSMEYEQNIADGNFDFICRFIYSVSSNFRKQYDVIQLFFLN